MKLSLSAWIDTTDGASAAMGWFEETPDIIRLNVDDQECTADSLRKLARRLYRVARALESAEPESRRERLMEADFSPVK
jgi:hypothetical protein